MHNAALRRGKHLWCKQCKKKIALSCLFPHGLANGYSLYDYTNVYAYRRFFTSLRWSQWPYIDYVSKVIPGWKLKSSWNTVNSKKTEVSTFHHTNRSHSPDSNFVSLLNPVLRIGTVQRGAQRLLSTVPRWFGHFHSTSLRLHVFAFILLPPHVSNGGRPRPIFFFFLTARGFRGRPYFLASKKLWA